MSKPAASKQYASVDEWPVYLLHFDRPLGTGMVRTGAAAGSLGPNHYLGTAPDVAARLREHEAMRGAKVTAVAAERGIGFTITRIWPSGGPKLERKLKRQRHHPRLCPTCNGTGEAPTPQAEDAD